MDVAHHFDVVSYVVEDNQCVDKGEHRLGQALRVRGHEGHAGFEIADGVVSQVAHRSAMKSGETVHRDYPVLIHLSLHQRQRVNLAIGLPRPSLYQVVGVGTDKTVSAQPFATGYTFQQEGVRPPGHLQVGRNRCF